MRRSIAVIGGLAVSVASLSSAWASMGSTGHQGVTATAVYVDCSLRRAGDGTAAHPFNRLTAAGTVILGPGDRLLLRRGTVCTGMLHPRGSGTAVHPVVIDAYGPGPRPRIDANGRHAAALWLDDMSHVIARNLELTNRGDAATPHRGVYLTAHKSLVRDVAVRSMFIHDIDGPVTGTSDETKSGGGIILQVLGDLPARFDRVVIEGNRIQDVARSGIFMFGIKEASSAPRPRANRPWPAASTGIVVRGNTLTRLAGDGIVPDGTLGTIVENNVVSFGNLSGRNFLDPIARVCNAGIWAFNSNNTIIQRNEVFGMRFGRSSTDGCDGTGFDADYNQDGGIIQFNYSHDNEGGFVLLCSDDQPRSVDIRYNLSVDDGHTFSAAPCKAPAIGTFDGLRFYNNTIVAPNPNTSAESFPLPYLYASGTFQFQNNVIVASRFSAAPLACGQHCSNNLYFRIPPSGTAAVVDNPLFVDPFRRGNGRLLIGGGFRLRDGSPAVGAGITIPGGADRDYFGNPIPEAQQPTIGFFQP
jgi:hypothetical protein